MDLLRIIERYITLESKEGESVPLRARRPDLFQLELTCENTNQELPYLQIVNKIVESYLERSELYRELSRTYYPSPLPFLSAYGLHTDQSIGSRDFTDGGSAYFPKTGRECDSGGNEIVSGDVWLPEKTIKR